MCLLSLFKKRGEEPSPKVRIPRGNVTYDKAANAIIIELPAEWQDRVWLTDVTDTHSMEPLIDKDCTVLLIKVEALDLDDLKVGDVIFYKIYAKSGRITQWQRRMHSIIEISSDDLGWFCYCQGLNSGKRDPWKIRPEHIKHFLVSIPAVGGNK